MPAPAPGRYDTDFGGELVKAAEPGDFAVAEAVLEIITQVRESPAFARGIAGAMRPRDLRQVRHSAVARGVERRHVRRPTRRPPGRTTSHRRTAGRSAPAIRCRDRS